MLCGSLLLPEMPELLYHVYVSKLVDTVKGVNE